MVADDRIFSGRETAWEPEIYNKFSAQREEPFWDLANLVEPVEGASLADLGCGDGRLTAALHWHLRAAQTLGVDSAPQMLAETVQYASPTISFRRGDIGSWDAPRRFDIIFANASLQWVPDHHRVIASLRESLAPGGQLAIQVPSNADHIVYRLASDLGSRWLGDSCPIDTVAGTVLEPEEYAELLHSLGFARHHVRLMVYGHHLSSAAETVEWVKGTSLNRFKAIMSAEQYLKFVEEYRGLVMRELGNRSPYFFTFKRILMWARLP